MAWASTTMQAIRIHQPLSQSSERYSAENSAPSSALHLDKDVPVPRLAGPNEILVRVYATTVIKDTLTWPEMYDHELAIPGHDFAGVVARVFDPSVDSVNMNTETTSTTRASASFSSSVPFKPGDEVYGMVHADRGGCWAEYVVVKTDECSLKPFGLSWEEAASIPLTALTAWQALFVWGGVDSKGLQLRDNSGMDKSDHNSSGLSSKRRVLITGASGAVGSWIVQLATRADSHVVCGTSSARRTQVFLLGLGAHEVVEYDDLLKPTNETSGGFSGTFDTVIDTVDGPVLEHCWQLVKPDGGYLVAVHSDSYDFIERRRNRQTQDQDQDQDTTSRTDAESKEEEKEKDSKESGIKAKFFIVTPSTQHLAQISELMDMNTNMDMDMDITTTTTTTTTTANNTSTTSNTTATTSSSIANKDKGDTEQGTEKKKLKTFIDRSFAFEEAVTAYDRCYATKRGVGKVVLLPPRPVSLSLWKIP